MDTNPPPLQPPPIIVQQPPRRGGFGWMLLALVLLGILGLVGVGVVISSMGMAGSFGAGDGGRRFQEITVQRAEGSDKIVVIDVDGIITSAPWAADGRSMVDSIADQFRLAAKDVNVKAVVLKVDSPGGEVLASDEIARAVREFQEQHSKPVVAAMGGLAASGGYYVSAPCQWIVANELTLTGSIGVIMQSLNYRGLMDKVGVQTKTFKSGRFKDMLSGSKRPEDVDPEEHKMVQDMVMETYSKFKSVVKTGRDRASSKNDGKGRSLAADWEAYADGRVLTGKNAYSLGFVDELGTFETALATAHRLSGLLAKAQVVRYQEPFTLGRLLGFSGRAEAKTLKIDVGIDLPKLEAGRPYFLSSTLFH